MNLFCGVIERIWKGEIADFLKCVMANKKKTGAVIRKMTILRNSESLKFYPPCLKMSNNKSVLVG
jgi:hypothetical protein